MLTKYEIEEEPEKVSHNRDFEHELWEFIREPGNM